MKLIDPEPIKKFIVDGLNNPDLKKAFGHDAIEILAEIEYAPTVDPIKHGRWIPAGVTEDLAKCSVCGRMNHSLHYVYSIGFNYCPHCGAKMDGGKEDV